MLENKMNIGLLSTAKDSDLVAETLNRMRIDSTYTDIIAITTAGKQDRGNPLATRALDALSDAGFTNVRELDIEGKDEMDIRGEFGTWGGDDIDNRLIVITGGDKKFLNTHLKKSGADTVITQQVKNGVPILTVSAGTVVMGKKLEVTGPLLHAESRGMGIIPATIVCHFGDEKERQVRNKVAEQPLGAARTIFGLRDQQALVGGNFMQVVGEGDLTVMTRAPLQREHTTRITKSIKLR